MKLLVLVLFLGIKLADAERARQILKVKKYWNSVCPLIQAFGHLKPGNVDGKAVSDGVEAQILLEEQFLLDKTIAASFEDFLMENLARNEIGEEIVENLGQEGFGAHLCLAKDFRMVVEGFGKIVGCDQPIFVWQKTFEWLSKALAKLSAAIRFACIVGPTTRFDSPVYVDVCEIILMAAFVPIEATRVSFAERGNLTETPAYLSFSILLGIPVLALFAYFGFIQADVLLIEKIASCVQLGISGFQIIFSVASVAIFSRSASG
uniref:Uncharacterized protein n=1 Tax=Panagrolaimus sp. JU765 TaxID=591449 RepID=A0AC34QBS6_9BILA